MACASPATAAVAVTAPFTSCIALVAGCGMTAAGLGTATPFPLAPAPGLMPVPTPTGTGTGGLVVVLGLGFPCCQVASSQQPFPSPLAARVQSVW